MYERILGEITAWRYGIPGLLCGNTIGTNREGHVCLGGRSTFLETHGNLSRVQFKSHDLTELLKRLCLGWFLKNKRPGCFHVKHGCLMCQ